MKKIIAMLCVTVMTASMLAGCGSKTAETTEETVATEAATEVATEAVTEAASVSTAEDVSTRTSLTVGFDADFPPYGYMDEDGNYVGFDLDLAQEVCDRLGWELVLQPIDWDSKDMELSSGSIDCIWNGFTMSDDRMDAYTWSDPYVDNSQVFVVAKDSGITSKADLAGKIVAVQADSSALEALNSDDNKEFTDSFAELTQIPEYNTAFMNLEAGAVDAVAMDIGVANYQIESRGDDFVILNDYLSTEVYGIGFLLGNTTLRDAVQEQLEAMAEDGTFDQIATDWGLEDSVVLGK